MRIARFCAIGHSGKWLLSISTQSMTSLGRSSYAQSLVPRRNSLKIRKYEGRLGLLD